MDDACLVFKTAFDWLAVIIADRLLLKDGLGPKFAPFLAERITIEKVLELADYPFPRQQAVISNVIHRTFREYNVNLNHYLIYRDLMSSVGEGSTSSHVVDSSMLKKSLEHHKIAGTTDCLPIYYIYKELIENTPLAGSHFYYYKRIHFYFSLLVALLTSLVVSIIWGGELVSILASLRL
ncbi:hypothetical protein GL50803_0011613 [Giardia duodenalis]|uniref:Uncharacterized protein n=1 Tax=Giardia intestinalis (strain ATCC 50803 / WB clone C6) TaxID=184922 RepID=A8BDJ4_GIAIC|nr:hypothetical protein GL50803_0011613 [Giardia intestinalis]KAE8304250.1 hypothetical protein GL50803_0011613 [Giardia intestinalis]|eukprot:XP_001707803.1 Hypothetical protein GL50803_11613 [Giardia lamblia ATCC 50803]